MFQRAKADLLKLGWSCHQLDQCLFLLCSLAGELTRISCVYVDDFFVAGQGAQLDRQMKKLAEFFEWGKWEERDFTLRGCEYKQMNDFSVCITQREFTSGLKMLELPKYSSSTHTECEYCEVATAACNG